MRIPSGTTDQYIYFVAVDDTDFTSRETGLSSFTVYRSRNGAAAAAMTTPTINEVSSSNMPGVYELLLDEDMTIGSGNDSEEMAFHITHSGMAAVTRTIELYRPKITEGRTLGVESDGDLTKVNTCDTNTDMRGTDSAYTGTPPTSAAIADAVLDEALSGHTTAGTLGKAIGDGVTAWVTATGFSTHSAADVWTSGTRTLTGLGFTLAAGDFGASSLDGKGDWNTTTPPTAAAISDAVWDEAYADHTSAGTFGKAVGDGVSAWTTATGFSTHSAADVWTVTTRVLTANTNLNDLDAAGVRTAVGLAAADLDTQLGDIPTVSEFNARTLAAADYFDPAADAVANVTLVATCTTNTDMRGTDSALTDKTGYTLASNGLDSISTTAPSGVASNFREMLVQTWRRLFKRTVKDSSTIKTYADDGTTVVTTQSYTSSGDDDDVGAAS